MDSPARKTFDTLTFGWLGRLRWVVLMAELAGFSCAAVFLKVSLPWGPVAGMLALAAATNLWLARRRGTLPEWHLGLVFAFDVLALTALLYWSGGTHNPFTSLYLVHLALAAMTLSAAWLWPLVVVSVVCYVLLFFEFQPLVVAGQTVEIGCPGYSLHLQGMALAFAITAAFVAAFVARLQRVLREREEALAAARLAAARSEQFAALATLSAGVAHELGSPLGTIAVASRELVRNLERTGAGEGAQEDARLIRGEVDRCRSILDRLAQKATAGVGEAAETFTAERLRGELAKSLSASQRSRLKLADQDASETLFLPLAPLVQALLILVQNGCEADRDGSLVELSVGRSEGFWEISVKDRGPGLDAVAVRHAGEPFFTTKPPGEGMGLGLFLVRTMALRLGGELLLENRTGGGLRAVLKLPEVKP